MGLCLALTHQPQPALTAITMPDPTANRWYPPRSLTLPWATPHDADTYQQVLAVANGYMDRLDLPTVADALAGLLGRLRDEPTEVVERLQRCLPVLRHAYDATKGADRSTWRQSAERQQVAHHLDDLRAVIGGRFVHYPCPCCGHLVFRYPPGSEVPCPVCLWADDLSQLADPLLADGENQECLCDAQRTYRARGHVIDDWRGMPAPPTEREPLELGWRPLDPAADLAATLPAPTPWPEDPTHLYYWRDTYWRRQPRKTDTR